MRVPEGQPVFPRCHTWHGARNVGCKMWETTNADTTLRVEPALEELPLDFGAFLSRELGISQADAEARLGSWLRALDCARYGFERLGPNRGKPRGVLEVEVRVPS